ncbi:16S rRNA (guanine(527)-N(7))-methyltransferase RsmG [Oceanotoga sp. DSM 15011]|jgi:16S rRNA (guanine527-N7)-methyltransferase|uniref:Ribosomal RNA small subunit methyltransferase G n=1 Tax=Oceanotoga teriensis TaxID=515440 RepID=A0AA45HJ38_9BACT|nr:MULTISPECIES: 16S rRNA (guanine(527)-N(7))-methyltransferase RsmG [Oceanotoga]MDN5342185.1 rRNA (guanine527-N7)-methyltransferase [Oceanotoga sp.]MDO7976188.1 16S rRNA (guanine(527)-N(7))-methyltransferase RsmG [Oceanotoga teriensis]PWJ95385.1 16S rRNA m(7)G-527 methyltransferase [Oceanotoga teriensis]UYP01024.1 16S rRNA (guanine(527)-N(7))-methyltransferase RsmG [Oceanotoga sp. DSM 15011]
MFLDEKYVKIMESYSLDIENNKLQQISYYLNMLLNYPANLTAIKDKYIAFEYHVIDSILAAEKTDEFSNAKIIADLGSGGGIPGIIWAILYPEKTFYLVDSIGKKTEALKKFYHELKLKNVNVINKRIEEFARENISKFDIVSSRALARADIALEYSALATKRNGYIALFKGPLYMEEEQKFAKKASKLLKVKEEKIIKYNLFEEEQKDRYMIIFKKYDKTPLKYPRETGVPNKMPLGGSK